MRVAALYDIHGNAPALEATLDEVPDDAEVVIGGDTVLGFDPVRTLELLDALGERAHWIRGNADRLQPGPTGDWVAARIGRERADALAALPDSVTLDVDGLGPTLFCHGSPRSDEEIITRITPETRLREIVAGVAEPTVVCGHTHQQFDRLLAGKRLVNAGSVGIPYEGRPGAYWTLLGPDVEHRRSDYDFRATADSLRTSDFPDAEQFAGWLFDDLPEPGEVAAYFERQAVEAA